MAGFLVGSLLLTWVLCSALNSVIEYAAIREWLNRGRAFLGMVVGVFVIAGIMAALALWGLPQSTLARDLMTPHQLSNTSYTSVAVNILFALSYCAFQLRRFWEE
ncbi:MAG: hypothetical protein SV765_17685 [Pseudomonadota bacterium]|nr:hypothetical protein [Pseudomonadales bacterium]MDY6922035.1 hypothetical protein [Pseudomonadota bacterium]